MVREFIEQLMGDPVKPSALLVESFVEQRLDYQLFGRDSAEEPLLLQVQVLHLKGSLETNAVKKGIGGGPNAWYRVKQLDALTITVFCGAIVV